MHALPQLPQLAASEGTQDPLQSSSPDAHAQLPPWQDRPPPQGTPQLPQLFESVAVFVHWPPHIV